MGGGKEQKNANQMITQTSRQEMEQAGRFDVRNQADLESSRAKGDELYGQMHKGYSSLTDPWKFEPGAPAQAAGGGGGGGGGTKGIQGAPKNDPRFKEVENAYRGFSGPLGGWDPARVKSMDENIAGFKEIARTGGVDEYGRNRIRGNGVYDEFQTTGGLSEGDRANIRSRATSVIPAMYQQMGDEANRMSSVQGGYGPGRAALQSRMARDRSSGLSDATRDAELGIMEQVNEGRRWGTEGMSSSELGLQDLLNRNKLGALGGASQTEQGLQDSMRAGRQWGISGIGGLAEADRQAALQKAAISASRGSANASLNQQQRQWEEEFGLKRYQTGLEGLGSLYTSSPDEYMRNKAFDLENRGLTTNAIGGLGTQLKTGNKNPWETAAKVAVGGAVGMFG